MDPDELLNELLYSLAKLEAGDHSTTRITHVTDLVRDLDAWLMGGGFLPERWSAKR